MIRRDENIGLMPLTPDFYREITDPELKILSKRLTERMPSIRDARDKAASLQLLKDTMQTDIVHFHYRKGSGETRSAFGTRFQPIISRHGGDPKGAQRDRPLTTFNYFDIVRKNWRSFRPESILDIDNGYTV